MILTAVCISSVITLSTSAPWSTSKISVLTSEPKLLKLLQDVPQINHGTSESVIKYFEDSYETDSTEESLYYIEDVKFPRFGNLFSYFGHWLVPSGWTELEDLAGKSLTLIENVSYLIGGNYEDLSPTKHGTSTREMKYFGDSYETDSTEESIFYYIEDVKFPRFGNLFSYFGHWLVPSGWTELEDLAGKFLTLIENVSSLIGRNFMVRSNKAFLFSERPHIG